MKYLFLILSSGLLISCVHGNCRGQQEAANGATPQPTKTPEQIMAMKESSVGERVKVYKADGTLQCAQGRKIEPDQMEKELKGLRVYSKSNKNDGRMRIQLCGSPTGNVNVFEIDRDQLDKAISYGFKEWTGG